MKSIVKAIRVQELLRLEEFIKGINEIRDIAGLETWFYRDLLPRGKKLNTMTFPEAKAYLIKRKEAAIYKCIETDANRVKCIYDAGILVSVKITIEWSKSKTWGTNPHGDAIVVTKGKDGIDSKRFETGGVTGCGFDKESTAIANLLNQVNAVLKPMYKLKDKNINMASRELFGYGSGYGLLPHIEGGVGVSCYPKIFASIGFKFEGIAHGKNFDVYQITKL